MLIVLICLIHLELKNSKCFFTYMYFPFCFRNERKKIEIVPECSPHTRILPSWENISRICGYGKALCLIIFNPHDWVGTCSVRGKIAWDSRLNLFQYPCCWIIPLCATFISLVLCSYPISRRPIIWYIWQGAYTYPHPYPSIPSSCIEYGDSHFSLLKTTSFWGVRMGKGKMGSCVGVAHSDWIWICQNKD